MTVNIEIPIVQYIGNDVTTSFAFAWSSDEDTEIKVKRNGALIVDDVDYTMEDYLPASGGNIVFTTAPATTDTITIYRETPKTQQVDYVETAAFPAETHESQMDKDTRILQELVLGGLAIGGIVDLAAVPGPSYVDITNTSGTDARIPSWEWDQDKAGVFHGEITESAPADGAPTLEADGYVWLELGDVLPPPGAYTPTSTTVGAASGWMFTQQNFWGPSPNFEHPFKDASYPEFFMSCVCRCTTYPSSAEDWGLFNILNNGSGSFTGLAISRTAAHKVFWKYSIGFDAGATEGAIVNTPIILTDELTSWGPNDYLDWIWLGVSYKQSTDTVTMAIVNLETGREFTKSQASDNNVNAEWQDTGDTTGKSICVWGSNLSKATAPVDRYWRGYMSQIMIHNAFLDLSVTANRRKLCHLDGVIDLGSTGQDPFGATPLVYLPNGLPSSNVGTLNIGTYPTDFFLYGTEIEDEELPPVSSS